MNAKDVAERRHHGGWVSEIENDILAEAYLTLKEKRGVGMGKVTDMLDSLSKDALKTKITEQDKLLDDCEAFIKNELHHLQLILPVDSDIVCRHIAMATQLQERER